MNAERLHVIAKAVRKDLKDTRIVSNLQSLIAALNNLVSTPTDVSFQKEVSQARETLASSLSNSASNSYGATWEQVLEETDIRDRLGSQLLERIEAVFLANDLTPAVAAEELGVIQSDVTELQDAVASLIKSFSNLRIPDEELEPGDSEVGILIPRGFVGEKLEGLGKELVELHKIFGVFAEIADGSRPGFEVRSISSSDFGIFIATTLSTAACIGIALEKVIAAYKNLLEIKKLRQQMLDQKVPEAALEGIETWANSYIEDEIRRIDQELLKEFLKKGEDKARKNELSIELESSMRKIAKRIDRGFNIEVRVEPLLPPEGEGEPSAEDVRNNELLDSILKARENMRYLRPEGEPILSLEDGTKSLPRKPKDGDKPAEGTKKE